MSAKHAAKMFAAATTTDRNHEALRASYIENAQQGRHPYEGWSTSEIAAYNRRLMFGANDEAFPSQAEWSSVVD